MADLIKCARIANQLQEAHETAQRLFGAEYRSKVAPWKEIVEQLCIGWKCSPVEVPGRMQREAELPKSTLLLFAAVVEVVKEADRG